MAFLLLLVGCVAGLRWISETSRPSADVYHPAAVPLTVLATLQPPTVQAQTRRLVYPYSVVPGGVASAAELHDAAEHDAAVAAHYSGFDYKRARVVEVDQPKLVYLSYRRGDHIYWSRKQASLHRGEKLLTDGHTTARTRCGNQVSVLPQADTSPEEPTMAELDRPDMQASGMLMPSSKFDSELLNVDPAMPAGPSSPGNSFAGGGPPGVFMPLPIGGGGSGPVGSQGGGGCPSSATPCNPPPPPPPPPPPSVPEPGTVVLVLSGAAAVYARYRQKR